MTEARTTRRPATYGTLPRHIAIIMDGNGRWAKARGLPRIAGHREGVNSVREITRACGELGIEALTLYTFSSENWRRPRPEVDALMRLLVTTIRHEVRELMANNVRLRVLGHLNEMPSVAQREMESAIEQTAGNDGLSLNLALSYGGRREILDAVKKIAAQVAAGEIGPEGITSDLFASQLYTDGLDDPELLIRTSGEARLSNFLLWQTAYTELVITDTPWPAFRRPELQAALEEYKRRERRFGRVSEQIQSATVAA